MVGYLVLADSCATFVAGKRTYDPESSTLANSRARDACTTRANLFHGRAEQGSDPNRFPHGLSFHVGTSVQNFAREKPEIALDNRRAIRYTRACPTHKESSGSKSWRTGTKKSTRKKRSGRKRTSKPPCNLRPRMRKWKTISRTGRSGISSSVSWETSPRKNDHAQAQEWTHLHRNVVPNRNRFRGWFLPQGNLFRDHEHGPKHLALSGR